MICICDDGVWGYIGIDPVTNEYGKPCCDCEHGNTTSTVSKYTRRKVKSLSINDYQSAALRTENGMIKHYPRIFNAALGLCGESGEVADLVKKWAFQGHPCDTEKLAEELGDVCWYLAVAADAIGITLEEIMIRNIEKLKRRYPHGFETDRSLHREDHEG